MVLDVVGSKLHYTALFLTPSGNLGIGLVWDRRPIPIGSCGSGGPCGFGRSGWSEVPSLVTSWYFLAIQCDRKAFSNGDI